MLSMRKAAAMLLPENEVGRANGVALSVKGIAGPPNRRVLLFGVQTNHAGSCRLPKVLKAAGFKVAVVAKGGSFLHAAGDVDRHFYFSARRFAPGIRWGLERACRQFEPEIVVPGDERAAALIRYWVAKEKLGEGILSPTLRDRLEHSLGALETLDQRSFKIETLRLARSVGVRVPEEIVVASHAEAVAAAERLGYPVVVKMTHGAGGHVVRISRDREMLDGHFLGFHRSATAKLKAFRRKLMRRDWFPGNSAISVQAHIDGRPAMTCAAALSGRMLAVITAFSEEVTYNNGPSSVVHLVRHDGMAAATAAMIEALGATGFISFDFIVDRDGREHLLECNPRAIQIFHLGHLVGLDLARSFADGLSGKIPETPQAINGGAARVALFPQEWRRRSASPALTEAYHDAPWDDPRLLKAMIDKRMRRWRGDGFEDPP
jgi:hypothetical protein